MDSTALLSILFRWMHVTTACVAVGSLFFMRVIVPVGLAQLDAEPRQQALLRLRRGLKLTIHPCILLFLISGLYNVITGWSSKYSVPGAKHVILTHIVLAGIVFTLSLMLLAGPKGPAWARKGMTLNLLLLFLTIALASTVKWMREHPKAPSSAGNDSAIVDHR